MAFLDSDPQVIPNTSVETRWIGFGTKQKRNVVEYVVRWAIDNTGGESPPSTWGGAELHSHAPEIEYGGVDGLYVAYYRLEEAWVNA